MPEGWKRIDARTAVFTGRTETPVCEVPAAPTPDPSPSPSVTPSPSVSPSPHVVVTPTPVGSLPTPIRPGLPRTGA